MTPSKMKQDQLLRALVGTHDFLCHPASSGVHIAALAEARTKTQHLYDRILQYEHVSNTIGYPVEFAAHVELSHDKLTQLQSHLDWLRQDIAPLIGSDHEMFAQTILHLKHPLLTTPEDLPFYAERQALEHVEYLSFGDRKLQHDLALWQLSKQCTSCKILLMHCLRPSQDGHHPELSLKRLMGQMGGYPLHDVCYLSLANNLWMGPQWPSFFSGWSNLTYLSLRRTSIAFPPNYNLATAHPNLQMLDLSDSGFDPYDVVDLEKALPNCQIVFNG